MTHEGYDNMSDTAFQQQMVVLKIPQSHFQEAEKAIQSIISAVTNVNKDHDNLNTLAQEIRDAAHIIDKNIFGTTNEKKIDNYDDFDKKLHGITSEEFKTMMDEIGSDVINDDTKEQQQEIDLTDKEILFLETTV